jgi:hypothetical protein
MSHLSMVRRWIAMAAVTAALLACANTFAGTACENRPLDAVAVERGLALAEHTTRRLDETGATVVVLARAGQNLDHYGLAWSHMGFAYRQPGQPWRVLHKLNDCGTPLSAVYRQGLGEFFLDRPARFEAAIAVPTPELQQRLLPMLTDNDAAVRFHTAAYSMVAYAWGQDYQQSNQWLLETLAGASAPIASTRQQAQAWLRASGYRPTTLHLNTFERLGARATRANLTFDDHPTPRRFAGQIDTVTADSVFDWLVRSGLAGPPLLVR